MKRKIGQVASDEKVVRQITKSKDPNERNERLIRLLFRLACCYREDAPLEDLHVEKRSKTLWTMIIRIFARRA